MPFPTETVRAQPNRPHAAMSLFGLLLIALSVGPDYAGMQAIRYRHYELTWEEGGGFSVSPIELGNNSTRGTDRYDGTLAVEMGIGLICFASMLEIWGAGIIWSALRPRDWPLPRSVIFGLILLSAFLQTSAEATLLAPWPLGHRAGLTFWTTLLSLGIFALACWKLKFTAKRGVAIFRIFFITFIAGTILFNALAGANGWWVGWILAVFASMSYAAHGILLYGIWHRQHLTEIAYKEPEPIVRRHEIV